MIHTLQNIHKAFRRCFYRKTASRHGGIGYSAISKKGERITCKVDSTGNLPTASWSYDTVKNLHRVSVGRDCVNNIANAKVKNSNKLSIDLLKEVIKHELGHARYTDRTHTIPKMLEDEKIPFSLFNLFEDCRIEYKLVSEFTEHGKFFWHRYVDIKESADTASEALYVLKQNEALYKLMQCASQRISDLKRYLPDTNNLNKYCTYYDRYNKSGRNMKTDTAICLYYQSFCNLSDGDNNSAIELLKCWLKSFGKDTPKDYNSEIVINGVVDPNADSNTTIVRTTEKDPITNVSYNDLNKNHIQIDPKIIRHSKNIARKLSSIVRNGGKTKTRLARIGSILKINKAITNETNCFKSLGKKSGKRKIVILIDHSGSMQDTWHIHGGKEFCSAFMLLNKQRLIDLNMIVSYDQFGYNITKHSIEDLMQLEPNGSHEALDTNLKKYSDVVSKADTVILFTDGYLTGNIVNESKWRANGTDLIACCLCNSNHIAKIRSKCNGYFTRSFIHSEPFALAQNLLRYITNK